MLNGIRYRLLALVVSLITLIIVVTVSCIHQPNTDTISSVIKYEDYISEEKCMGCHKNIYDSFLTTAHHLTGLPAEEKNIKGSFNKEKNTYSYTPSILLSMEKRDSGLFQVAYFKGEEKKAMRFDMVIGSGVMGQSFLTWRGNKLFQLPITYYTAADQWSNSPGFPTEKVLIDRIITSRCLECHITFAQQLPDTTLEPTAFDHQKIIYGVGCQKCHGPAAKHVDYHTSNPADKKGKYIINPGSLSRQQQLDVCMLCHGGNIQKTKPSFSFTPGKNLVNYFIIDSLQNVTINSTAIDVHGNQAGLLKASKCFRMSTTMTCNTCHNSHINQRGDNAIFSQKCMECHNINDAKYKTPTHLLEKSIEKNCIDCHMPLQPSKSINVYLEGMETPKASLLRSHFIGIYKKEDENEKQH